MYLVSRTKNRFYHILGSENGLSPLTTLTGHTGRNFLYHESGLGWTFKIRLYLLKHAPDDVPTLFRLLAKLLLSLWEHSTHLVYGFFEKCHL